MKKGRKQLTTDVKAALNEPLDSQGVVRYLNSQDDFVFEMRVLDAARAARLEVTHGGTYIDVSTGRARQFDIRASAWDRPRSVHLAVEAKATGAAHPLVVCTTSRALVESQHEVLESIARMGSDGRPFVASRVISSGFSLPRPYEAGRPVGRSLKQVSRTPDGEFEGEDGDVFAKYSQAIASAADMVVGFRNDGLRQLDVPSWGVFIPIVVVPDGVLWTAHFNSDGSTAGAPTQVDSVECYSGFECRTAGHPSFTISHFHVMTLGGFSQFATQLSRGSATGIFFGSADVASLTG